jgi:hypothetical protein
MTTQSTKKQTKSSLTRKSKLTSNPVSGKNREPGEVEIRELAEIIYHQRIERGEYGTAEEDWLKAENYLSYSGE